MPGLQLYDRRDCPYSRLVRSTLDKLDLNYEETVVPEDHADRTELEWDLQALIEAALDEVITVLDAIEAEYPDFTDYQTQLKTSPRTRTTRTGS